MPEDKKFLRTIWTNIPIFLSVLGVVGLVFNTYLASRLLPVVQSVDRLDNRIVAIEDRNEHVDPLVDQFIEQKGTIKAIFDDIAEIKEDIRDLKRALNVR